MKPNLYIAFSGAVKPVLRLKLFFLFAFPLALLMGLTGCTGEEEDLPQPIETAAPGANKPTGQVYTALVTAADGECVQSIYWGKVKIYRNIKKNAPVIFYVNDSYGDYLQPYYQSENFKVEMGKQYELHYELTEHVYPFPGDDPETIYCQAIPFDMETNTAIRVVDLKALPN